MNEESKAVWAQKLKDEIREIENLQKVLRRKKPSHAFLEPLLGNALASLVDILIYLEGRNYYLTRFNEDFFKNRQVTMHRTFISDVHIMTEEGLREIIVENKFKVTISSQERVNSIVEKIKTKLPINIHLESEMDSIIQLGGKYPSFNDHLEAVFRNSKPLPKDFETGARIYFKGISVLRNNVSHPNRIFSDDEIEILNKAKLGKAVDNAGAFTMTFEGYRYLIMDIIKFFDTVYTYL